MQNQIRQPSTLKTSPMDIEKIAKAIEDDAGMPLPDIRQALAEAEAGIIGRITTPEQILVRTIRIDAGLSQQAFADLINTPVATLQGWEQGRFAPPGGMLCFLKLLYKHPELIAELQTV